jgi:hypothetical protein
LTMLCSTWLALIVITRKNRKRRPNPRPGAHRRRARVRRLHPFLRPFRRTCLHSNRCCVKCSHLRMPGECAMHLLHASRLRAAPSL